MKRLQKNLEPHIQNYYVFWLVVEVQQCVCVWGEGREEVCSRRSEYVCGHSDLSMCPSCPPLPAWLSNCSQRSCLMTRWPLLYLQPQTGSTGFPFASLLIGNGNTFSILVFPVSHHPSLVLLTLAKPSCLGWMRSVSHRFRCLNTQWVALVWGGRGDFGK